MKAGIIETAVIETLEGRRMMSGTTSAAGVRSYDGTGNNVAHPLWGSVMQPFLRISKAAYADGVSAMAGQSRPSARVVSNTVAVHGEADIPNARHMSSFAYLWGQFIDHDLDLTDSPTTGGEEADVAVPAGDAYFDPNSTGTQVIGFVRSNAAAGTGTSTSNPRQQANDITAFIDGSMVYGSSAARAAALREFSGGRMKVSAGDMLPFNTMGLDNATEGGPDSMYYAAGDVRANENIELTAIQTLFVREHNRLAGQIAAKNPTWTDEQIYQQARRLVIGEIQAITYKEFLPALLGRGAIRPYTGYKPDVNPGISNEFATAAFRIGHSMVANDVEFLDNNGNATRDEVPLANAFFNPTLIGQTGIDGIMKYLVSSNAEEIDTKIVDGLRNLLFGPPGAGGFDLASLNIQRGRDHGLADYNSTRAAFGLPRVKSFAQITSDPTLQAELKQLYGSVDNIDLWVGGLAEDHLPGSSVGPTFERIMADQFTRVRDGDRFWYQRNLSGADLKMVEGTSLADIVRRNLNATNVQDDAFFFNVAIDGRVWDDRNGDGRMQPQEQGVRGRMVSLVDTSGDVVQTVKTGPDGRYHFGGVDLGTYHVQLQTDGHWEGTNAQSGDVVVTRGGVFQGANFGTRLIGGGQQQRMAAAGGQNGSLAQHQPPPPQHQGQDGPDVLGRDRRGITAVLS